MAKREAVTKDEHYDLVSVLYHALQGDETSTTLKAPAMKISPITFATFRKNIERSPRKPKSFSEKS